MTTQTIQDELIREIGAEFVRWDDGVVVTPATRDEVSAVLRCANDAGVAVTAWGGGTKQGWGNPVAAGLRLETGRMHTVREHTWQDMTCTVEAGCTWAAMQAKLAEHGQFVALDPLWPERATVGGIVATNDSGSLRHKYGSLRDLIIGMTIVLADGTVAKSGGKVVKNVAGYDLHKLMTGAYGTLGVVTEVTFRLHSLPRDTRSVTVSSGAAEPLDKLLHRLLDSQLSTQRMQMRANRDGSFLDVELAAMAEVLEAQAETVAAHAGALGLHASQAANEVWAAGQGTFADGDKIVVKATMLPSEIAAFAAAVGAAGGDCVTQAVGVGIASLPADAVGSVAKIRKMLEGTRGSLTVLNKPAGVEIDRWGATPDSLPVMRAIKQRFDPKRILNPGRLLGGIG